MNVVDVTEETFHQEVMERSKDVPVVVDFWGPHCGPCKVLGPTLEKLADEGGGKWVLAKVNTTENQQLAFDFQIQGIPAVKAIVDGKVVHEFVGLRPERDIVNWLNQFVPNAIDELAEEIFGLIDSGQLQEAERLIPELGADDRSLVARALILAANGDLAGSVDLVDGIPEYKIDKLQPEFSHAWIASRKPDRELSSIEDALSADKNDRQAKFERAMFHANEGTFEAALEDLIAIVMVDRDFGNDVARIAAVRIFDVVGTHSDFANTWRKKLGRAMY